MIRKTFILMNKENEKVVYGMQCKKCLHTLGFLNTLFDGHDLHLLSLTISRKVRP